MGARILVADVTGNGVVNISEPAGELSTVGAFSWVVPDVAS